MYADLLLTAPLVWLVGAMVAAVALAGAVRLKVRLNQHMRMGRADLSQGRARAAQTRERARAASRGFVAIGRGAETDAERLARLRADAEVRSRGTLEPGGGNV